VTGRRGRRRKKLLDNLKETREYWKLKEEAIDRTLWRTRFARGVELQAYATLPLIDERPVTIRIKPLHSKDYPKPLK
jgi:hypothetical protein